jgi:hypothetical protein
MTKFVNEDTSKYSKQPIEERIKSYVETLKNPIKVEDHRREEQYDPQETNLTHKDRNWKTIRSRWNHSTMYQNSFYGYFYTCNGFVHKVIDYRTSIRRNYMRNNYRDTQGFSRRNYNSFYPLMNYKLICYNCNNFGHIEKYYKSNLKQVSLKMKIIWEQKKENPLFIQEYLCAQKIKEKWFFDNGCSIHMIGDKTKFITLKKNEGKVTFGDNGRSKIVGKGTLILDNGNDKI